MRTTYFTFTKHWFVSNGGVTINDILFRTTITLKNIYVLKRWNFWMRHSALQITERFLYGNSEHCDFSSLTGWDWTS
jgi:hypothetical protein